LSDLRTLHWLYELHCSSSSETALAEAVVESKQQVRKFLYPRYSVIFLPKLCSVITVEVHLKNCNFLACDNYAE
jgi:hypothetical protein